MFTRNSFSFVSLPHFIGWIPSIPLWLLYTLTIYSIARVYRFKSVCVASALALILCLALLWPSIALSVCRARSGLPDEPKQFINFCAFISVYISRLSLYYVSKWSVRSFFIIWWYFFWGPFAISINIQTDVYVNFQILNNNKHFFFALHHIRVFGVCFCCWWLFSLHSVNLLIIFTIIFVKPQYYTVRFNQND